MGAADATGRTYRCLGGASRQRIASLGWVRLLKTFAGVGTILGSTIYLEIGAVSRFPDAAHLASYAGLVPTVHSSGGKCWQGPTPRSANHFLKSAFGEAANVIATRQKAWADKHVVKLYQWLKANKCHSKGSYCRGSALSRIELVDSQQETTVSGASAGDHVFVQKRVSAAAILAPNKL